MPNLSLQTLELATSLFTSPQNGPTSSADYNENQRNVLNDLVLITEFINSTWIPFLNSLSSKAALPADAPTGIEGSTVLGDTTDDSALFYNSTSSEPLSVADSLRFLQNLSNSIQQTVTDLGVQVASLQSTVSSSSQNNLSNAVQRIQTNLATLATQQQGYTTQLQALSARRQAAASVSPDIPVGSTLPVTVTWPAPFADDNYVVALSLNDDSGSCRILTFSFISGGTGISVLVENTDTASTQTPTVNAIAQHN